MASNVLLNMEICKMIFGIISLLLLNKSSAQNLGENCTVSHTNTRGVCSLASKCLSARQDFQNNGINPTFCEHSGNSLLVCCRDGSTNLNNSPVRRPVWNSFTSDQNRNKRLSEKKCDEHSQSVIQRVRFTSLGLDLEELSITAPKCDYTGVKLIVGGENATQGEFPHMVAVGWIDFEDKYAFHCGGSLISSRFVLTAGHCSNNPKMKQRLPAIVRLGDQNLDPVVRDGASPVDVKVKTVHKHPNYEPPKKKNDIALLELDADVSFTTDIRPACLWTKPDFSGYTKAVATGWGVSDLVTKEVNNELQKVSLSLLENDFCDPLLLDAHSRLWKGFIDSQMCAGELRGGKDTCQGDSGSPLQVVSKSNKCIFHVIGITSFGRRCAASGKPAVYTRVSSYLDWIESVVWPGEQ